MTEIKARHRYDAYLDGQSLREAAPGVIITDIYEGKPEIETTTELRPAGDGSLVMARHRQWLTVRVTFVVREMFDLAARMRAIEAVNEWAQDGKLGVSYRDGQYLQVIVTERPDVGSIKKWTESYAVEFTAYYIPYWQAEQHDTASGAGTSFNLAIMPHGRADTPLEAEITPSGTLTSLDVVADEYAIHLRGLNTSSAVVIDHDERGFLRITSGGASLLPNRLPTSDDEVMLKGGRTTSVAVMADVSVSATIKARGRYL